MGLGAALIVDKKVVWMKGYGFADKERAVPFTPDTVMNIGSISKTFTGVALMRAAGEDGDLTDAVAALSRPKNLRGYPGAVRERVGDKENQPGFAEWLTRLLRFLGIVDVHGAD